jgi:hypothetical protein
MTSGPAASLPRSWRTKVDVMSDVLGGPANDNGGRRPITIVYLRVVALLLLAAGLVRACQILGITADGRDFSDLAPAWRAGAAGLLLADLFAAIGLWVGAAWGAVMWSLALAVEVSMYTLFADLFGSNPLRVTIHCLLFAIFLAFAYVDWRRAVAE